MNTLVFVDYENGASYDKSHQFHKKQGYTLILATHTFLTKMSVILYPLSVPVNKCHFSWQVFFALMRIIFHASSTVKCQTIIFSILRKCMITFLFLFCHSQLVMKTIRILSNYYHDTIRILSSCLNVLLFL